MDPDRTPRTPRTTTTATVLAASLPAVPLLLLLTPALLGGEHARAEDALRQWAAEGFPHHLLTLQLLGALALAPLLVSSLTLVPPGTRGRVPALAATVLGGAAAVTTVLVLGYELAQGALVSGTLDVEAGVRAALVTNDWLPFLVMLLAGVGGCVLTLPLVTAALARHGLVRWTALAAFALPVVAAVLPLPGRAAELLPSAVLVLACLPATADLLRGRHRTAPHRSLSDAHA
ncbi:hypothetical protein [Kineococcus aurantiacus]|uniref:DUF4386 family protein n=1 Tax=Kineococcus aurantiacus TaxID=37633 RepID=A0A7Y9AST5_9ACTN|nr:hypothetical protein [Kineococcus aurantiacus]NYD21395.1 hypothetical protein [Kineococcus aurantiacus]